MRRPPLYEEVQTGQASYSSQITWQQGLVVATSKVLQIKINIYSTVPGLLKRTVRQANANIFRTLHSFPKK